jgi:hypothetical protein
MKKSIFTMVLLLVSLVSLSTPSTTPFNTFTLQGKFISENSVNYEVYVVNPDSSLQLIETDKSLKFFSIDLEVEKEYVIKFTSKTNETKYLYVSASEYGGFGIDVDFNRTGSARLSYNNYRQEYQVMRINSTSNLYANNE